MITMEQTKTIVITGGNSGIGYESCLQLAKLNHRAITGAIDLC